MPVLGLTKGNFDLTEHVHVSYIHTAPSWPLAHADVGLALFLLGGLNVTVSPGINFSPTCKGPNRSSWEGWGF